MPNEKGDKQQVGLMDLLRKPQEIANRLLHDDPETYIKAVVELWEEEQKENG
jgi:hypothetical protein